jgi:hypothetical protein
MKDIKIPEFNQFLNVDESRLVTQLELERKSRDLLRSLGVTNPTQDEIAVIVAAIHQVVES